MSVNDTWRGQERAERVARTVCGSQNADRGSRIRGGYQNQTPCQILTGFIIIIYNMTQKKEKLLWCLGCRKPFASRHSLRTHSTKFGGKCAMVHAPRVSPKKGIGAKARYEQRRKEARKEKKQNKFAIMKDKGTLFCCSVPQPMSLSAWYRHQRKFQDCPKAKKEINVLRDRIKIERTSNILRDKVGEDDTDAPEPGHPSVAGYV